MVLSWSISLLTPASSAAAGPLWASRALHPLCSTVSYYRLPFVKLVITTCQILIELRLRAVVQVLPPLAQKVSGVVQVFQILLYI